MQQFSIEQMQSQIRELQRAIDTPGTPPDEIQMHLELIQHIQKQIAIRQAAQHGPVTPPPPPPPTEPIKHTKPPSQREIEADRLLKRINTANQQPATNNQQPTTNLQPPTSRHIHAGHQTPVNSQQPMSATIQADHATNPHNPTVTITWADGYTYTGDETAIRGRFVTTLRDTLSLRLVQKGRYAAMWRWSSPWRAAGFYQALTHLCGGTPPTLKDLDIKRPNDLTTTVFAQIVEKSLQTISG